MPPLDQISDQVAYADGVYYGPITGQIFDADFASTLIEASHQVGQLVEGVDFPAGGTADDSGGIPPLGGTVTADENQANLDAASAQAMAQAGLTADNRGNWSQADAVNYIQIFKDFILSNAYQFTPATVQMAQNIQITQDLSQDAGRKPIDPAQIGVAITDLASPFVDLVTPLGTIPTTVANVSKAALDAANAIASATSKAAAALNNSTGLAPLLVPIALFGALFLAANSFGRDPAGQSKKFISTFV